MPPPGTCRTVATLSQASQRHLRALIDRCESADGMNPLDEADILALDGVDSNDGYLHALWGTEDAVYGYGGAHSVADGIQVALVVDPSWRRRGVATSIVRSLAQELPRAPMQGWAHGHLGSARSFCASIGAGAIREVWRMDRHPEAVDPPEAPPGVVVTTYDHARDAADLLAVNAAAFADHPEQGQLSETDLATRMRQAWFNAEDILLARDATTQSLLAFHWMKIEPDQETRVGEIYVLGVAPAAQGRGMGKYLTIAGINHLTRKEVERIDLYVDGGNTTAVSLYEAMGFKQSETHAMYRLRQTTHL